MNFRDLPAFTSPALCLQTSKLSSTRSSGKHFPGWAIFPAPSLYSHYVKFNFDGKESLINLLVVRWQEQLSSVWKQLSRWVALSAESLLCVRAVGGALGAVTSSEIQYSVESDMRNTGIIRESKCSVTFIIATWQGLEPPKRQTSRFVREVAFRDA